MEPVMASSSDGTNQAKRLLRWRKIFKKFKAIIVKKIVAPVVNVIRKHGTEIGAAIGAVAGGVAGFVSGGPAGIWPGANTGFEAGRSIGSMAQSIIKACIPEDCMKIRCEADKVEAQAARGVIGYAVENYIKGTEVYKAI